MQGKAVLNMPKEIKKEIETITANTETDDESKKQNDKTTMFRNVLLNEQIEWGYDEEYNAYARVKVANHFEVYALNSRWFHDYAYRLYEEKLRGVLPKSTFENVRESLASYARNNGKQQTVKLRTAKLGNTIYLNLCNDNWETIKITVNGWSIEKDCPVWFKRTNDMDELPIPTNEWDYADIKQFKEYLNCKSSKEFNLIEGYILGCLLTDQAKPILVVQGTAGSGKTTVSGLVRSVFDPAKQKKTISRPKPKIDDIVIDCVQHNTLVYDNFSAGSITAPISDMFCTIATNQGYSKRTLYSDTDETVVRLGRNLVINGIDDLAQRQDLLDRSIVITMETPKTNRTGAEIQEWFDHNHANILGFFLKSAVTALKNKGISNYSNSRMTDFVRFVEDAHTAFHWSGHYFEDLFDENKHNSFLSSIETNPFVSGIVEIVETETSKESNTTNSFRIGKADLVERIKQKDRYESNSHGTIPASNQVKGRLKRDQPLLKQAGIEFKETASKGTNYVTFYNIKE